MAERVRLVFAFVSAFVVLTFLGVFSSSCVAFLAGDRDLSGSLFNYFLVSSLAAVALLIFLRVRHVRSF